MCISLFILLSISTEPKGVWGQGTWPPFKAWCRTRSLPPRRSLITIATMNKWEPADSLFSYMYLNCVHMLGAASEAGIVCRTLGFCVVFPHVGLYAVV